MKNSRLTAVEPWWAVHLGLYDDGTVRKIDVYNCEVPDDPYIGDSHFSKWKDICALDSSRSHVAALQRNGEVKAFTNNYHFEHYRTWKNIVQVKTGYEVMAGLEKDGRVLYEFTGGRFGCCEIPDVKYITDNGSGIVGLSKNGTLFVIRSDGTEILSDGWQDVVEIAALGDIYGLKKDGTVISYRFTSINLQVSEWKDIVHIDAGSSHLLGLNNNGKAFAIGDNDHNQCEVGGWENTVYICAGCYHTVGIDTNGRILNVPRKR